MRNKCASVCTVHTRSEMLFLTHMRIISHRSMALRIGWSLFLYFPCRYLTKYYTYGHICFAPKLFIEHFTFDDIVLYYGVFIVSCAMACLSTAAAHPHSTYSLYNFEYVDEKKDHTSRTTVESLACG